MTIRVGINGMGRIGRLTLRAALDRDIEVVAVNDVMPVPTMTHLLRFDSTYGRFPANVASGDGLLYIGNDISVVATTESDPAALKWADFGADIVIESTGRFRDRAAAAAHLSSGARKVVLSAPGKNVDATFVLGVNEHTYDPERHDVISNASCTTNCVAPMVKVMADAFGIAEGLLTTVHAFTNDQSVLDRPHKDLRRARTASTNIIPTSTGAARSVGEIMPQLAGHLDGLALRVPVETGSLCDVTFLLHQAVNRELVNDAFWASAHGALSGIVRYSDDPIVSRDIIADPASCIFDSPLTQASGRLVKIFGWYDNEWGYTQRLLDLVEYVGARLP